MTQPRKGLCFFVRVRLHPGAQLLICLALLMAIQAISVPGLVAMLFVVLVARAKNWRMYSVRIWRMRWLFLSIWLVFAFSTPGEAYQGWLWAPTYEGLGEASLHLLRIVVLLLVLLACLSHLGKKGLQIALWSILAPLQRRGVPSRALVARLALVLEHLEHPGRRHWQDLLFSTDSLAAREVVRLELDDWQRFDRGAVVVAWLFCLGVWLW